MVFSDILLLIVFNGGIFYNTISLLELLYRPFFPSILYCAPNNMEHLLQVRSHLEFNYIMYETVRDDRHINGAFFYRCMEIAMRVHSKEKGILMISDDTLITPTNLGKLNTNLVWRSKQDGYFDPIKMQTCNSNCTFHSKDQSWYWWGKYQNETHKLATYD